MLQLNLNKPENRLKLMPHQESSVEFLLRRKRAILADQPRVGKTLPTAVACIEHLPALIVCPAIAKEVWRKAFETLGHKALVINGRQEAELAFTQHGDNNIVIINYDLLHHTKGALSYKTLVLDESHRIKSHAAQRTKACLKFMKVIPRVYALSGTPIPNRPIELWPLLHGLGIYRGGYYDFAQRYAKMWKAPWGLDVSGASNLPELKQLMMPHVLRRKKEDVFMEYKQPQVSLITFDMPVDKREKNFDADALFENPNALVAFEGLSEIMREAGLRKAIPAVEFIEDKLRDGDPVVVFAHHKDVVDVLAAKLKEHKPVVITGDTPNKQRHINIEKFQHGKTNVIIGNIAAMSEGVDLSRADTVIFVEATWQTSALEQASSRVENIAKTGFTPMVYILTIRASLDHTVLGKVLRKLNIIDQII